MLTNSINVLENAAVILQFTGLYFILIILIHVITYKKVPYFYM